MLVYWWLDAIGSISCEIVYCGPSWLLSYFNLCIYTSAVFMFSQAAHVKLRDDYKESNDKLSHLAAKLGSSISRSKKYYDLRLDSHEVRSLIIIHTSTTEYHGCLLSDSSSGATAPMTDPGCLGELYCDTSMIRLLWRYVKVKGIGTSQQYLPNLCRWAYCVHLMHKPTSRNHSDLMLLC